MEQTATPIKDFFSHRKNQSFLFFAACFFTFLFVQKSGFEWKWCHLFFSYEFGFLKRGLIGQLFRIFSIPATWDNFAIFSSLMLTGVTFTFYNLIKNISNLAFTAFAVLFICTPALLRNLVHDWGRFDQIAIIFIFLLLLCTNNFRKFRGLLCLSPLLLFMHEATLIWAFPTILAITFLTDRKSAYLLTPIVILCEVLILKFGELNVDANTYTQKLMMWATPTPTPTPISPRVVATLTDRVSDVIAVSVSALTSNIHITAGKIAIGVLLSFMGTLYFIKDKIVIGFALLSLFSACVLFFVALDHFRWISLMCFIILFYLLYAHQKDLIRNEKIFYFYLILLGILGLFFNPVGIYLPYMANIN